MNDFERITQETQTIVDNSGLRELWEAHNGEFNEFTEFAENNLGSFVLWKLVETDKPYRVWQRVRVEEDE